MKKTVKSIISIILAIAMISGLASIVFSSEYFRSKLFKAISYSKLFSERKEEPDSSEADEKTDERYIYKRVVIIGVDGGGVFFKDVETPNIDKIFENGAITYEGVTATPSISGQCWGSLLHGVVPELHGINNGSAASFPSDSPFPSIFNVLHKADPDAEMASIVHWAPVNNVIVENDIGVYKVSTGDDEKVTEEVLNYLDEHDPRLLFMHFDDCDGAGHASGYGSPEYYEAMKRVDGYIGQVYDKLVEKDLLDDTLIILVPDHGGTYTYDEEGNSTGSHGGDSPEEMTIMVAVAGKTVEKGTIGDVEIRDIAAIACYALGLEQPETWSARVPSGLFDGVEAGERAEFEYPEINVRFENEGGPTPLPGSGNYITDFIPEDAIYSYSNLDGDSKVSVGPGKLTLKGKVYYVNGFVGQGARMEDGYYMSKYVTDMDSFSIGMWLNVQTNGSDNPILFGNDDRHYWDGYNGWSLRIGGNSVIFNIEEDGEETALQFSIPQDYRNGWMYLLMMVDRENGTVSVSTDFCEPVTKELPEFYDDISFTGKMHGILFAHNYHKVSAIFDEITIFTRTLTNDEIESLGRYYGVK